MHDSFAATAIKAVSGMAFRRGPWQIAISVLNGHRW
jgi:hypothetical protein